MVLNLYIYTPVAACLFWVILHALIASRTETFHLFSALFLCCGLYIYSEACNILLEPDTVLFDISVLVGLLVGPCIVPLLILYIRRLSKADSGHPLQYIWTVIPVSLFTGGAMMYLLKEDSASAADIYHLITEVIYTRILMIELIVLIILQTSFLFKKSNRPKVTVFGFLFKGRRITLSALQTFIGSMPMIVMIIHENLGHELFEQGPGVTIITTTFLLFASFTFGFNALLGDKKTVKFTDLRNVMRYNYKRGTRHAAMEKVLDDFFEDPDPEIVEMMMERLGVNVQTVGTPSEISHHMMDNISNVHNDDSDDKDSLLARFKNIVIDEKAYLQPRLSLDDIAMAVHSNKTYVSKLVNNSYNMSFPELINKLRVNYAQQYIVSHKNARQEEIAQASGFLSASSFNTTFKKVTGMTPKVWIASAK